MSHIIRRLLLFALLALMVGASKQAAWAQSFVSSNATINSTIAGDVVVGFASLSDLNNGTNRTSPTVNIVSGGKITGNLFVYNNSTINLNLGRIGRALNAYNFRTVNVILGSISGILFANDASTVHVSGGTLGTARSFGGSGSIDSLVANDESTVIISGGDFNALVLANGISMVTISHGTLHDSLIANEESILNVSGGSINTNGSDALIANDESAVTISGGDFSSSASANDTSIVTISGANIGGSLEAAGSSRVTLTGGFIGGDLVAHTHSMMTISGGRIAGSLYAFDGSAFYLAGRGFNVALINADINMIIAFGGSPVYGSLYYVSGILADGTVLNNLKLYTQNGTGAAFYLLGLPTVPRPEHGNPMPSPHGPPTHRGQ